MTMLVKVISGGQSGADKIGLEIAKSVGLDTGGTAPKYFKTENGPDYTLGTIYNLIEDDSEGYNSRTKKNVINSDATVLFGDMTSPGTRNTINYLRKHEKPFKENPTSEELTNFIIENNISILNVAGNRGSKLTYGQMEQFRNILRESFKSLKQNGEIQG